MNLSEYCRIKWERSLSLKKKGDYQEAEKELKEALEEQPEHPLLKSSLAQLYLNRNRLTEARILVESILSLDPEYPQALYVLGEIYSNEDNLEEALRCFNAASRKEPRPYLIHSVVKTLRRLKRYDEALERIETLLMTERDNPRLLKEKALILNRMDMPGEALRTYQKVKELDPEDPYVAQAIYKLKSLKRPDEEVIVELQKVLSLPSRKENPQLHGLLGEKLKKAGRLKEAAMEYRKAKELAPENLFFLKQEGFCRYRLGDYREAIRLLGEAFRKDPTDHILKSTLKKIYSISGDMDGFIGLLEKALEEHPHQVKLMGTLRSLKKKISIKDSNDA